MQVCKSKPKHGDSHTKLYTIWSKLNTRRKYFASYKNIYVCLGWRNYKFFKDWALTNGYTDNLSIDRINVYKGYYPANCRWTTPEVQSQNKQLIQKNNTTGFRGVSIRKQTNSYRATITVKGKHIELGDYSSPKEAALAYDRYVLEHNLIHRPLNILKR